VLSPPQGRARHAGLADGELNTTNVNDSLAEARDQARPTAGARPSSLAASPPLTLDHETDAASALPLYESASSVPCPNGAPLDSGAHAATMPEGWEGEAHITFSEDPNDFHDRNGGVAAAGGGGGGGGGSGGGGRRGGGNQGSNQGHRGHQAFYSQIESMWDLAMEELEAREAADEEGEHARDADAGMRHDSDTAQGGGPEERSGERGEEKWEERRGADARSEQDSHTALASHQYNNQIRSGGGGGGGESEGGAHMRMQEQGASIHLQTSLDAAQVSPASLELQSPSWSKSSSDGSQALLLSSKFAGKQPHVRPAVPPLALNATPSNQKPVAAVGEMLPAVGASMSAHSAASSSESYETLLASGSGTRDAAGAAAAMSGSAGGAGTGALELRGHSLFHRGLLGVYLPLSPNPGASNDASITIYRKLGGGTAASLRYVFPAATWLLSYDGSPAGSREHAEGIGGVGGVLMSGVAMWCAVKGGKMQAFPHVDWVETDGKQSWCVCPSWSA